MVAQQKKSYIEGIGHLDFPSVLETKSEQKLGVVDHIKQWIQE